MKKKKVGQSLTWMAILVVAFVTTSPAFGKTRYSTRTHEDVTTHKNYSSAYGPQSRKFGAGLYLGEPMGFTLKGYINERVAIDGVAGYTFDDKAFALMSNVTVDIIDLPIDSNDITFPLYVGGGAKLELGAHDDKDTVFGLRVPVGVALQWINHPVEIFAEIAPGIDIAPSADFDLTGGAGVRFYF